MSCGRKTRLPSSYRTWMCSSTDENLLTRSFVARTRRITGFVGPGDRRRARILGQIERFDEPCMIVCKLVLRTTVKIENSSSIAPPGSPSMLHKDKWNCRECRHGMWAKVQCRWSLSMNKSGHAACRSFGSYLCWH